jgi:hypothetical protein
LRAIRNLLLRTSSSDSVIEHTSELRQTAEPGLFSPPTTVSDLTEDRVTLADDSCLGRRGDQGAELEQAPGITGAEISRRGDQ